MFDLFEVQEPYIDQDSSYKTNITVPQDYIAQFVKLYNVMQGYLGDNQDVLGEMRMRYEEEPSQETFDKFTPHMKQELCITILTTVRKSVEQNLLNLMGEQVIGLEGYGTENDDQSVTLLMEQIEIGQPLQFKAEIDPMFCKALSNPTDSREKVKLEVPIITEEEVLNTKIMTNFRERFGKTVNKKKDEVLEIGDKFTIQIDLYDDNNKIQDNRGFHINIDTLEPDEIGINHYLIGLKANEPQEFDKEFGIFGSNQNAVRVFNDKNDEDLHMVVTIQSIQRVDTPQITDDLVKILYYGDYGIENMKQLYNFFYETNQEDLQIQCQQIQIDTLKMFMIGLIPFYEVKINENVLGKNVLGQLMQELQSNEDFVAFCQKYNITSRITPANFRNQIKNGDYSLLDELLPNYLADNAEGVLQSMLMKVCFDKFCEQNSKLVNPSKAEIDDWLMPRAQEAVAELLEEQGQTIEGVPQEALETITLASRVQLMETEDYENWIILNRYQRLLENGLIQENPDMTLYQHEYQNRQILTQNVRSINTEEHLISEEEVKEYYFQAQENKEQNKRIFIEKQNKPDDLPDDPTEEAAVEESIFRNQADLTGREQVIDPEIVEDGQETPEDIRQMAQDMTGEDISEEELRATIQDLKDQGINFEDLVDDEGNLDFEQLQQKLESAQSILEMENRSDRESALQNYQQDVGRGQRNVNPAQAGRQAKAQEQQAKTGKQKKVQQQESNGLNRQERRAKKAKGRGKK